MTRRLRGVRWTADRLGYPTFTSAGRLRSCRRQRSRSQESLNVAQRSCSDAGHLPSGLESQGPAKFARGSAPDSMQSTWPRGIRYRAFAGHQGATLVYARYGGSLPEAPRAALCSLRALASAHVLAGQRPLNPSQTARSGSDAVSPDGGRESSAGIGPARATAAQ
jgi:hypothetical protein